MKKGNVLLLSVIFITICIIITLLIAAIFMSHVNSILYNLKLEMYSINRAALIAVNKNKTSIDDFSYNKKEFKKYFENAIKNSYGLDKNFQNPDKLISSLKIVEYQIYEKNDIDKFLHEKCKNRIIHTVIEVKIKPIIMRQFFEKIFTFTIHEDVNLDMLQMEV